MLPGAEPYRHDGGEVGVLLCHGFTGSPQSMRPWGEYLADRGLSVSVPLLPGHGTRWQDMQITGWQDWYAEVERELLALRDRCRRVFVFGLSMGGSLTLRLAARHPSEVSGIALVNPAVRAYGAAFKAVPVLRHLMPSVAGIASDIAKDGQAEVGYDRTPLHAVYAMTRLWRLVEADLPRVTAPLLLMTSRVDHVVDPANSDVVAAGVGSTDITRRTLDRSYHVATLDHDAEEIFRTSYAFVRRLEPEAAPATEGTADEVAGG
nr:alpha/beta fold hydrolase [Streptomyces sp. SID5468]